MLISLRVVLVILLWQMGACYPLAGFPLQYQIGQSYFYTYTTETSLNQPGSPKASPAQSDVGIKFSATIELTPVWGNGQDMLVKLSITKPKLHSIARSDVARDLKGLPRLPIFFHWDGGKVGRVFAAEDDSTLSINIKKGIISIFQIKVEDGKHEEVDATGECDVSYVKKDNIIKRIKTSCQNIETTGQFTTITPLMSVPKNFQSETTYYISDDIIQSAKSMEQHTLSLNMEQSVASVITMKQDLNLLSTAKGQTIKGEKLEEVIKKINKSQKLELYGMVLATSFEATPCVADKLALADRVSQHRENLGAINMATTKAAFSFLELVDSFRKSSKDSILGVLREKDNEDILEPLLDVATAAQTTASQEAILQFLNFEDSYHIDKPERYLLAAAFSSHPSENLINNLFSLYQKDIPSDKLTESVGEALGATIYTYCRVGKQCKTKLVKGIIKTILEKLDTCVKDGCKPMHIRALGNAGVPDTIPVLLKQAETSNDSNVCEAAIKALRRMGDDQVNEEMKSVMRRIFHEDKRGYDTAVRSQALNIILSNNPSQEDISRIMMATTDPYNTEYDMYVQARLFNLMESDDKIRGMVKESLKMREINNWNILAPKGKGLAFTNLMAETSSQSSTYFMYVENARSGVLKRSGMDIIASSPSATLPIYSFTMYAAGMEGLLGKEIEQGQEDVSATAGMSLNLMDVSLRPISFFTGQAGLMSAVWSAPSEPMSALQTNILLTDHLERLHLQNGLIVETDVQAALSLDLSGSLSISLWNKNSKSLIINSGAIAVESSASIVTSSFKTGIHIQMDASSIINFQTDVDFYDGIKMCLQMGRPESIMRQSITKYEHARGFSKRYISKINRSRKINALSYPLPKPNAVQCRTLLGNS